MSYNISKLSNGLPVVTYNMPHIRSVAINYIVGVGSRYENAGEEGISHFLEHMAFKGTYSRTSKEIAEEFDSIGGQFNAYTSKETTVYYTKVLDEKTERSLDILSDIILNSKYDQADIDKEFKVITQEIAQVQDNPDDLCYEKLIENAFKGQPLGKSILGTVDSISKFNSKSFSEYISKHYSTSNSVLSAAGNIDHDKFVQLAEKKFGKLKSSVKISKDSSKYTSGENYIDKDLEQSTIFLGFNSTSFKEVEKYYYTQILSLILGGGLSSRLFQNIREKSGLAYSVGSFNGSYSDNGVFSLYAGTSHDKVSDVITKMSEEIHKIKTNLTDDELDRAKSQIKSSILMAEEKSAYKSEEVGKNYLLFNRFVPTNEVINRVEATKTIDIMNISHEIFSTTPCLSIIGKKQSNVDYEKIIGDLRN